jgi:hypothetical protein
MFPIGSTFFPFQFPIATVEIHQYWYDVHTILASLTAFLFHLEQLPLPLESGKRYKEDS